LLYWITRALAELDLDIRSAKVETFGVQAVDSSYVRDLNGVKIQDERVLVEIKRAILHD
jgi:[protein-PII] uridylyltransferase